MISYAEAMYYCIEMNLQQKSCNSIKKCMSYKDCKSALYFGIKMTCALHNRKCCNSISSHQNLIIHYSMWPPFTHATQIESPCKCSSACNAKLKPKITWSMTHNSWHWRYQMTHCQAWCMVSILAWIHPRRVRYAPGMVVLIIIFLMWRKQLTGIVILRRKDFWTWK